MLFNSYPFLLVFLPVALAAHWLSAHHAPRLRLPVLAVLSLAFYSFWNWKHAALLVGSIAFNFAAARLFLATRDKGVAIAAIAANLALLAFYKYLGLALDTANGLFGSSLLKPENVLPLGISFFTFHHVMYLVDLAKGVAPRIDAVRYALYIGFFPQVLAGPLVRWSEILAQFDADPFADGYLDRIARGAVLLVLGLGKKVLLGDPLSEFANPVFAEAAAGHAVTLVQAWQGVLAFTFQIYFDFSGYTDMAIGIALMLGFVLPQNFHVPYRAANLQDFWRRWHATLSRFLRDYLYVPLGGNRSGPAVQACALVATMALGGLWHGAAWTFVAWGLVHGLGLAACALWRKAALPMPAPVGWLLTFAFVTLAWVLFRVADFGAATRVFSGLAGLDGLGSGLNLRLVSVAALVAMVGPTTFDVSQSLRLTSPLALGLALLFMAALLTIGDDANYEFIYFRF